MPNNKKKVNGSTPAVVVPQKDAMVVLKTALRSCSSDRLFGIYDEHVVSIGSMLPAILANKGARLDGPIVTREFLMNDEVEARDAMISHLRVAMAIDRLNGGYRQIVTRELNSFGGLKMSCVKQRGESFTYTMGFGQVLKKYFQGRNKEIVIVDKNKRVRTSWNVGRLLNQQFDRLKEGGDNASPLLPGNTLHDQNSGVVWFLKTPETEEEATLLKATTTLEPTRFYGLTGYDLLLLLPVGKQLDNVGDIFATREEALMLYNGHDVKGKFETFNVSCGHCKKSEFELKHRLQRCGKCQDAFYCSSSYQKNDWDNHKVQCEIVTEIMKNHEKIMKTKKVNIFYLIFDDVRNGSNRY